MVLYEFMYEYIRNNIHGFRISLHSFIKKIAVRLAMELECSFVLPWNIISSIDEPILLVTLSNTF